MREEDAPPRRRQKYIVIPLLVKTELSTQHPQLPKPTTLNPLEHTLRYKVPTVPTSAVTPTADVPSPPTFTPVGVPQLTTYEVPPQTTYEVPTVHTTDVPTYNVPTYQPVAVPKISEVPTYDVLTVPTYYDGRYEPLPHGWWRLLPPYIFFGDRTGEGAYNAQAGKRQILALA